LREAAHRRYEREMGKEYLWDEEEIGTLKGYIDSNMKSREIRKRFQIRQEDKLIERCRLSEK
jgi:hypothetical protein